MFLRTLNHTPHLHCIGAHDLLYDVLTKFNLFETLVPRDTRVLALEVERTA